MFSKKPSSVFKLKIRSEDDYFYIKEEDMYDVVPVSTCPYCGSKDIAGGSWVPDTCVDCRAFNFFGSWILDKE